MGIPPFAQQTIVVIVLGGAIYLSIVKPIVTVMEKICYEIGNVWREIKMNRLGKDVEHAEILARLDRGKKQ